MILIKIDIHNDHLSRTWDIENQGFDNELYRIITPFTTWDLDTKFFVALEERTEWAISI